jgi:rubrerythrin
MIRYWKSTGEVLDYAMATEIEARAIYRALAAQASSAKMKILFERLAVQEDRHFKRLQGMKKGGTLSLSGAEILALSRGISARRLPAKMSMREAYRYAIRAEKDALQFYSVLGRMAADPAIRRLFETLAEEEERHRVWLEERLKEQQSSGFLRRLFRFMQPD